MGALCRNGRGPDFQQEFVGAIHIPHASDAFPHLAERDPMAAALKPLLN
jgi:hypothetical protein